MASNALTTVYDLITRAPSSTAMVPNNTSQALSLPAVQSQLTVSLSLTLPDKVLTTLSHPPFSNSAVPLSLSPTRTPGNQTLSKLTTLNLVVTWANVSRTTKMTQQVRLDPGRMSVDRIPSPHTPVASNACVQPLLLPPYQPQTEGRRGTAAVRHLLCYPRYVGWSVLLPHI